MNLQCRVRLVQGVEVQSINGMIEKITALLRRPMHADLSNRIIIVLLGPTDRSEQGGGKHRAGGELSHPLDSGSGGDRHDAGDDRNPDSRDLTPVSPVMESMIIEEELGTDPVGTGIDLGRQIFHREQGVGRIRMAFGKSCDPDGEFPAVSIREAAEMVHQICGVGEFTGGSGGAVDRRIAAEGEYRPNSSFDVSLENPVDIGLRLSDAGQMRNGMQRGFMGQSLHELVRPLLGRATGSVGHGYEGRIEGEEFFNPLVEEIPAFGCLRGEELEGNTGRSGEWKVAHGVVW